MPLVAKKKRGEVAFDRIGIEAQGAPKIIFIALESSTKAGGSSICIDEWNNFSRSLFIPHRFFLIHTKTSAFKCRKQNCVFAQYGTLDQASGGPSMFWFLFLCFV